MSKLKFQSVPSVRRAGQFFSELRSLPNNYYCSKDLYSTYSRLLERQFSKEVVGISNTKQDNSHSCCMRKMVLLDAIKIILVIIVVIATPFCV